MSWHAWHVTAQTLRRPNTLASVSAVYPTLCKHSTNELNGIAGCLQSKCRQASWRLLRSLCMQWNKGVLVITNAWYRARRGHVLQVPRQLARVICSRWKQHACMHVGAARPVSMLARGLLCGERL